MDEEMPIISSSPTDGPVFVGGGFEEKRSRKKWIVAAIVALALVAVGVGGYFLVKTLVKRAEGGDNSDFYRFANYVLYGKDEDTEVDFSEINIENETYVVTGNLEFQDNEQREENAKYYAGLYEIKNDFMEVYGNGSELVEKAGKIVDFLKDYINKVDPTADNLANLYGKEESYVENYVSNYYKAFNESSNKYTNEYGAIKTEILRMEADLSVKYNLFGVCLSKNANAQECAAVSSLISEEDLTKMRQGDTYVKDAIKMVRGDSKELVYCIVEIAKTIGVEK